jgi:hypothetical protein
MMATFELRITFAGLILYVPQRDGTLELLMPRTPLHTAQGHCRNVEAHAFKLVVDRSNLLPQPSGPMGRTPLPLEHCWVKFPSLGRTPAQVPRDDLVPLDEPLLPDALQSSGAERLMGRATLFGGTARAVDPEEGWRWKDGKPRRMTYKVSVMATMPGKSLDLRMANLCGVELGYQTLYPHGGMLHFELWHALPKEIPPKSPPAVAPKDRQEAMHFAAYYELTRTRSCFIPRYHDHTRFGLRLEEFAPQSSSGTSALSCMSAQV